MSRKKLRLYLLLSTLVVFGLGVALVLRALNSDIVFFLSPADIAATPPPPGQYIRIGGLVEAGSVKKDPAQTLVSFSITDLDQSVPVVYRGILPDLFREGQGVVVEGSFGEDGQFTADEVLAKHDETYMPPEVAKALKESGRWQETSGQDATTEQQEAKP